MLLQLPITLVISCISGLSNYSSLITNRHYTTANLTLSFLILRQLNKAISLSIESRTPSTSSNNTFSSSPGSVGVAAY